MVFTIKNLSDACNDGDIQRVRDIVTSKEVDINDTYNEWTPLMHAMYFFDQSEVVRYLLTQPELQLDKRDSYGTTALHWACRNITDSTDITVVRLFCQDRRCTPSVVNIKDNERETALLKAVDLGWYDIVKELEKIEGTDFRTKDRFGSTLIEIAKNDDHAEMVEFLEQRNKKVESLKVISAYSLANCLKHKSDVEKINIPCTIKPLVEGFIDDFKIDLDSL